MRGFSDRAYAYREALPLVPACYSDPQLAAPSLPSTAPTQQLGRLNLSLPQQRLQRRAPCFVNTHRLHGGQGTLAA